MSNNKENKKTWLNRKVISLISLILLITVILVIQFFHMPTILAILSLFLFCSIIFLSLFIVLKEGSQHDDNISSNDYFNITSMNIEEGLVIYTPQFKVLHINPAAERILKIKSEEAIGKIINPNLINISPFQTLTQVIFPSLAPSINQISEEGWPQIVKIETSESELKLLTVLDRISDQQGKSLAFVKIIKNNTREEQLIKTKNEFITTAAHQLRTPVTAMSWAFEQLHDSVEDSELKKITQEGKELAARSSKIINDLLSVIQIEEGKYNQNLRKINIVDLVKKIAKEANLIAKEYNITIETRVPNEEIFISADEDKLVAALSALTENAVLYNNDGGNVTLSIKKISNESIELSISDTGIGISEEEINKIFTKFFRGDSSAQIVPNGSGLGLYITKNVIESIGGSISVSSTEGRGTSFNITLPISK